MKYNGWKNRETWNVSLWINNDEPLYRAAVAYVKVHHKDIDIYVDFIRSKGLYKTPDGIKYISSVLDYEALNDMMRELVETNS